jgi:hypothetical protein
MGPLQCFVRRQGPDAGWKSAATADSTRASAAGERVPTDLTMRPELAVKSLPGRAKQVREGERDQHYFAG